MREAPNRLDYADDPAEFELQMELYRTGIENDPRPDCCPDCKAELKSSRGFAGEEILYCPEHGVCWEDNEGAIRNVF